MCSFSKCFSYERRSRYVILHRAPQNVMLALSVYGILLSVKIIKIHQLIWSYDEIRLFLSLIKLTLKKILFIDLYLHTVQLTPKRYHMIKIAIIWNSTLFESFFFKWSYIATIGVQDTDSCMFDLISFYP